MTKAASRRSKSVGFTLLEMAIVLAIMSIVSVSLVAMFSAHLKKSQYKQTIVKMEAIQKALVNFRIAFNRIPCPADATLPVAALYFGLEAANPGTCSGGNPTDNFGQTPPVGQQDAQEGMVPTKTLQLPDDYAFDGWGRRIMYVVSKDFTQIGAFSAISAYDSLTRMTILNAEGSSMTSQAGEVLISFGPNGHGAFPRNGGTTRINASSVNADERNNCDCTNAAVSTGLDGTFVQKETTINSANLLDSFDDIVYFASRSTFILPSSLTGQPFSFSSGDGSPTGCQGGPPICQITSGVKICMCGY